MSFFSMIPQMLGAAGGSAGAAGGSAGGSAGMSPSFMAGLTRGSSMGSSGTGTRHENPAHTQMAYSAIQSEPQMQSNNLAMMKGLMIMVGQKQNDRQPVGLMQRYQGY